MHRGFTKLFNTIVTSTIWQEDDKTRIVWITMLAIADADGRVSASIPGLAQVSNVSLEACEKALKNLLSPDTYSRTKDHQGRRIAEVDGGWDILNYVKYRRMMNEEERREYKRIKQAEYRKRGQTLTNVDNVDTSRGRSRKQKEKQKQDSVFRTSETEDVSKLPDIDWPADPPPDAISNAASIPSSNASSIKGKQP